MKFIVMSVIVWAFLCQVLCWNAVNAVFIETPSLVEKPEDEQLDLLSINGRDFLSNITKDISGKPWHDDREQNYIIRCLRPAKCERIQTNTCFGSKIPYKYTSGQLSEEGNQESNIKKLNQLEALRNVPKCWEVIQPFLCAVYLPKCTKSKGKEYVYLPSYEMCQATVEPCRVLYDTDFFPSYLKCDEKVFPCKNCSNDVREMKFTPISSQCISPLVATDSAINYYPDIEGCGLQCRDPMYTEGEHESVQTLIFWGATLCLVCNFYMIATFSIHDWRHSKHPAWNLFYISICLLCNWIGWMLQFVPGHRDNIVCRRDGTLRYSEPSAGDNLACIIPFILVYYFSIAANIWFAIFTYHWYLQTKDRGSIRDRIDKESFYFHFIAWALPFILTVTIMVLSEVDGNSITGICFVGYRNRAIRTGLVLVPVAILSFISVIFTFRGILNLNRIKRCSATSSEEASKLSSHILGMGIRTMLVIFFTSSFFVFENYEVPNATMFAKSLTDFITCKIVESSPNDVTKCKIQNRPSVAVTQLGLLSLFGVNLVITSWCWTTQALKTWKRFVRRKTGNELSEDDKMRPKHRIIADAYAKRKHMDGDISVSIDHTLTDPAGLNFDVNNLNPAESDGMSSTLRNYMYNIINRRGAVELEPFTLEDKRNGVSYPSSCAENSYNNSEVSVSVRHIEVESRRNSVDSQISLKMSETNFKATLESRPQKHKGINMKTKKRQRNILYTKRTNRRASSSSIESQRITNQMQNFKYKYPKNGIPNVGENTTYGRRNAISARPGDILNELRSQFKSHDDDDDDQSIDEAQTMEINEPSNMLVPVDMGACSHQRVDSIDRLDASHDNQASLEQIIIGLLRNSDEKKIKHLLKMSHDYPNGVDKSHRNSTKRSKTQRNSHHKMYEQQTNDESHPSIIKTEKDSGTSMSSSIDREMSQSQNSKRSCDVGIQANDFDIAGQRSRNNYDQDEECTEMHHLLPNGRRRDAPTIVRKNIREFEMSSGPQKMQKVHDLLWP
ncbi:protein smoothened [Contarinia nasturtii]|uniref:protein smoothened n=1 Tax=Contarinia nasturtii TaxID=265458 RepID=UPI0012D42B39|nr:protein smoothened [Contarinia nasturtii]